MGKKIKDEYSIMLEADNLKHKKPESRRAELSKKIILLLLGIICCIISLIIVVSTSGSMGGALFGMTAGTLFLCAGMTCFANLFWDSVAPSIVDGLFNPGGKFKKPAEKLSPIKGLIRMEKFSEAIEKLDEILERRPFKPEPYLMLVEIYLEHLNQPEQVVKLIQQYFTNFARSKRSKVVPENIELLMIYSDTCQELGQLQAAIELLSQEAERKTYSIPEQNSLNKRLNVLLQ